MKRKWTRRLAALLTACMLVSLFPVSAFAETAPETPQEIVEEMAEGNAEELGEEPGEDPAEQLDDQEIPATENDEETTIDSPAPEEAVEDEPEDDPPAEEEPEEEENAAPAPRTTEVQGWTVRDSGAAGCLAEEDGKIKLSATGLANFNQAGSAVIINDNIADALNAIDGEKFFEATFEPYCDPAEGKRPAFGLAINAESKDKAFYLGYDSGSGWYAEYYGGTDVPGETWPGWATKPDAVESGSTYKIRVTWDNTAGTVKVSVDDTEYTLPYDGGLYGITGEGTIALKASNYNSATGTYVLISDIDYGEVESEEPEPPVDEGPALPTPEEIAELLKVQIYDQYNGSHRPTYTLTAADYTLGNIRTFNSVYPYVCDLTLKDSVQSWVDKFNASEESGGFNHVLLTAKDGFLGTTNGVATLYYSAKEEKWCFPPSGSGLPTPGVSIQTNGNFMQIYVRYGYSYRYLQHDGTPFVTDRFVSACSGSHSAPTYRPTGVPGYVEDGKYYAFTGWQAPAEQDPNNEMVMIFRANYDEVEGLTINEDGSVTIPGGTKLGSSTIPLAVTSVTVRSVNDLAGLTVVRETMTLPDGASVLLHDGSTVTDESTLYCFTSNKTYEVLVPSTGLFLVSGSGATRDYKTNGMSAPWVYKGESREGIKEVRVMEGVTGLGNRTFSGCKNLETVTLADSVTDLGISVFEKCESLTQVTAMGLTEIGDMVFSECTSLKNVVFGSSLMNVNETAFTRQYASYTITDLIVYVDGNPSEQLITALNHYPEKCTYNIANLSGGEIAELNNGGFATLKDREGLTFQGWFAGENKVEEPAYDGTVYAARWEEANTSIQVSETVNGNRVNAAIENGMVTIPGGYTLWVDSEKIATVPKGITSVKVPEADVRGLNVFVNSGSAAANYTILTLPEGSMTVLPDSTTVDDTTLYCCDYNGAYPVIAPSAGLFVMSGSGAMDDFGQSGYATAPWVKNAWGNGITTVKIMEGVTYIGENAFYNCKNLTNVSISRSVQTIGKSAFENCVALESITIPEGVREIKDRAFSGCEALTGIVLPDSVTTLGGWTFQNCSAMKTVELPAGISTGGAQTFAGCTGLKNLVLRGAPGTIDSPELLFGYSRPADLTVYVNDAAHVTDDLTTALNKLNSYRIANLNGYAVSKYMDGALAEPVKDGVAGVWYDEAGNALVKGEDGSYSLPEEEDFGAVYKAAPAMPEKPTSDQIVDAGLFSIDAFCGKEHDHWSGINRNFVVSDVVANTETNKEAYPYVCTVTGGGFEAELEKLNSKYSTLSKHEKDTERYVEPVATFYYSAEAQKWQLLVDAGRNTSLRQDGQYYYVTYWVSRYATYTWQTAEGEQVQKVSLCKNNQEIPANPADYTDAENVTWIFTKWEETTDENGSPVYTAQYRDASRPWTPEKPDDNTVNSLVHVRIKDYYESTHQIVYDVSGFYNLGDVTSNEGNAKYPYVCRLTLNGTASTWLGYFNSSSEAGGKVHSLRYLEPDAVLGANLYFEAATGNWVIPSYSEGSNPGVSVSITGNYIEIDVHNVIRHDWVLYDGTVVRYADQNLCGNVNKDIPDDPITTPGGYVADNKYLAFTGWEMEDAQDGVCIHRAQYAEAAGVEVQEDGSVILPGGTVLGEITIPKAVEYVKVPTVESLAQISAKGTSKTLNITLTLPAGSETVMKDGYQTAATKLTYADYYNRVHAAWTDEHLCISGTGDMWGTSNGSVSSKIPWYSSMGKLTSVTIMEGVTDIGDYAFKGCERLETIIIPGTVDELGDHAFYQCTSVKNVVFTSAPSRLDKPSGSKTVWAYSTVKGMIVYVDADAAAIGNFFSGISSSSTYNVANLNGGSVSEVVSGTLATPERTGYIFQGWFDENDSKVETPAFDKAAYTAKWEKIKDAYVVTIDGEAYEVKEGDTLAGILPENPTKEGYTFVGWFDGEDKVTADTLADDGMTITSKWEINKYTVTFNAAGGRVNGEETVTVEHGETLGDLPTASRSGYRFRGWYLNGAAFDADTVITSDITLTAQWRRNSSSRPNPPVVEIEDPDTPLVELPFDDVESDAWYKEAIDYVYEKNLMQGSSEDGFAPDVKTDRGTMAKVLYNLAGGTGAGSVELSFPDVMEGVQDVEAIYWAASHGLVVGYDNGNFGPRDNVTREQMAVMLYRYAKFQNMDVTVEGDVLKDFTDNESIGDWSREALAWAVSRGLFSGRDDGRMAPGDNATRAEVAAVVMRFHQMLEKDSAAD